MTTTPINCLDAALAATVPVVILGAIATRLLHAKTTEKVLDSKIVEKVRVQGSGIGVRIIQFVAVGTIVPIVGILALHGLLQGEAGRLFAR
jgi:hypothetical protein